MCLIPCGAQADHAFRREKMHEFGSVHEAIKQLRSVQPVPTKVKIRLGKMRGSARTFEEMFREHTRDTELDGIGLELEQVPVEVKCSCGFSGTVKAMGHVHFVRCPLCNDIADVRTGNELEVQVLE